MSQPPGPGEPPAESNNSGWSPPDPQQTPPASPWSAPPPPATPSGYEPPPPGYQPPPPQAPYPPQQPYQPGYGQPYQQPTYGQSPYAGQGQWDDLTGAPVPAPPPPRRSRGRLIAALVAVVALAGGGAATYVAVSDSSTNGASTPEGAIRNIVTDINKSDLIGMLDDLVPGERKALATPVNDEINRLKQTNVLDKSADPNSVAGVQVAITNLTFSGKTIPVTNTVQVVEITGGTVTINADLSKVPLTKAFLDAAFPHGLPSGSVVHKTLDIAQAVRDSGKPARVAAQQDGGRWYPSLFYTFAFQAANEQAPAPSDYIAPRGAASPEAAVTQFVDDLFGGKVSDAIALLSPDEMAAAHSYGRKLADSSGIGNNPLRVTDLSLATTNITDGKRLTLKTITVKDQDSGDETKVTVNGDCISVATNGDSQSLCPDDLVNKAIRAAQNFGLSDDPTPAQRQALRDILSGVTSVGVDVSDVDGQWYVNPVRTFLDLDSELYSHVQGNDIIELIKLAQSIQNR